MRRSIRGGWRPPSITSSGPDLDPRGPPQEQLEGLLDPTSWPERALQPRQARPTHRSPALEDDHAPPSRHGARMARTMAARGAAPGPRRASSRGRQDHQVERTGDDGKRRERPTDLRDEVVERSPPTAPGAGRSSEIAAIRRRTCSRSPTRPSDERASDARVPARRPRTRRGSPRRALGPRSGLPDDGKAGGPVGVSRSSRSPTRRRTI